MHILDITIKDLSQVVRDWKMALFLVIMPFLFTLFFSAVSAPAESDPRLPVGIVDHDPNGALSASLINNLTESQAVRPVSIDAKDEAKIDEMIGKETYAAVVIIPEGYSDGVLDGEDSRLEVIAFTDRPIGHTAVTAVRGAAKRTLSAAEIAHLSTQLADANQVLVNETARRTYTEEGVVAANAVWQNPPLGVSIETASQLKVEDPRSANPATQSSPGMIVQFAVFGLITSASVLVVERKSQALQRMLTTPVHRWEIIAGHMLAMALVTFLQQVVLIGLGQFLLGVDYLISPLGTLMVVITLSLWAASLGLLISTLAKGEEQVIMWAMIAMFLFSALGGAWMPLEFTGKAFSTIGHLTPTAWAMDGFQNIVLRGSGMGSVLLPVGILLAYAVGFFGLAAWRFKLLSD
jgi:ABC-2 type transport system permease protein